MPELPEVETIARELNAALLVGSTITKTEVFWEKTIATPSPTDFCKTIAGQKIEAVMRRGKFIILSLSHSTLLIHLRMTGKLLFGLPKEKPSKHERARLLLNDGRVLRYEDQRKFGKLYLVENPDYILSEIGLEPFSPEFTLAAFKEMVKRSAMPIKPFLLNQHFVAGVGNIYADEALWQAKIHPQTRAHALSDSKITALHRAIPDVLQKGIEHKGTSLGSAQANYFSVSGRRGGHQYELQVFRRDGLPCLRCHTPLIKIVVAQRGTHLCPHCQKIGLP